MKINGPNHSNFNPYQKQMNKQDEVKQPLKQQQDKVEISSAGKALQDSGKTNETRQNYINEIKSQVENGNYKVDHQRTAGNIVDFFSDKK
ncbi:flagellar biosynthesis anti-sigma factor FlgM [Halobacillus sp. A1]|uniref:flagellar biosynthesis anti-sigma factor FlgM n=1 Tax=Halobacillus sp. A1 TaxID=2880262 RepID=UPI0020A64978|nr:flagellar biosynthesis anti-sigma factor FlgM [Halobacillus sp. A1]MCP3031433.1 flagellar biosynthesis anti-sigma factor FlgM [Halobacillus sp. A1]